jgi:3-hydroxyisobutyrate dehydrogenase
MIGLGKMGLEMSRALMDRRFSVLGFDIAESRRRAAADEQLQICVDALEVFRRAQVAILSLPAAQDVAAVVRNAQQVLIAREKRTIIVDTSTSDPEVSRALTTELHRIGHGFLDAPVSGGPSGARTGDLTMMVGGLEEDLAIARPVVEAVASKILHVGSSGAGNVAKLVNNLLVAAHVIATSEGLRLAAAAGVSGDAALRVINAATGRSTVSEVHFPKFILSNRFDSGFSMGLMRKDVSLAIELARDVGVALPLAELVGDLWVGSIDRFSNDDDFTRMAAMILGSGGLEEGTRS